MTSDDFNIYSPEASDTQRFGDWQGNILKAAYAFILCAGGAGLWFSF